MFYEAPTATLCDICEGSDCGDKCTVKAEEQRSSTGPENYFETVEGRKVAQSTSTKLSSASGIILVALLARLMM